MSLDHNPFDTQRSIGSVAEVHPTYIKVNFPSAEVDAQKTAHGVLQNRGYVGEFVAIEESHFAVFGKVTSVALPDSEKPYVEESFHLSRQVHPVGTVQLLSSIDTSTDSVIRGISVYPRIGARVYAAHPSHLKYLVEWSSATGVGSFPISVQMASLAHSRITDIRIPVDDLFGRHCAVLGSTGSGKSWTIGRLIEECSRFKSKLILIDATGEFRDLSNKTQKLLLGNAASPPPGYVEAALPHRSLLESDLFAMLRPSGQVQGPKLRAAIKSLKLLGLDISLGSGGVIKKLGKDRTAFETAYNTHIKSLENPRADFDISHLSQQIEEECVWPTDFQDPQKWGKEDQQARSNCISLVSRVDDILSSPDLQCIFSPGTKPPLFDQIDAFLRHSTDTTLVLSLKYLSFAHNTKELIANAIGRYLLEKAKSGVFTNKPVLLLVDEAHQFLNKSLGDEHNRYPLDQFELIAKEGRKYSLNICISTQRPRDIPEGVLSQMGTLVVHRLINDKDREVVERAAGEIDRSAASFLPNLAPGEAIIIGVNFPLPVTLKINEPKVKPRSEGADFQRFWS